MGQSSSFVEHQPSQLYLLRSEFQLVSCPETMAKRMQEEEGEERSVEKSQSSAMNLSSHVPESSLTAKIPIASESLGVLSATGNLSQQKESGDVDLSTLKRGAFMERQ